MNTEQRPMTTAELKKRKAHKQAITVLTAYDFPTAKLVEEAGVDVILVGDSLGMVVLGYDSTVPVTMADMLHHAKAVTRAAKRALVVVDMPFLSYHGSLDETLKNAGRLMQEGAAKAVKLEGGSELASVIRTLTQAGIPVMGHIGLTPQSVHQLGGYKVQGKQLDEAKKLLEDAEALAKAGAFAIVLECVPEEVARLITERIEIPTIGIGAGAACDGQVLVLHDIVQFASTIRPKFVKSYANIGSMISEAVKQYVEDVKTGQFPAREHVFHTDEETVERLYGEGVQA
ncbi:MAG: 3-methyl-2-oxobutanoate hydroxymethyltransferase [Clostridia bacterium]